MDNEYSLANYYDKYAGNPEYVEKRRIYMLKWTRKQVEKLDKVCEARRRWVQSGFSGSLDQVNASHLTHFC